MGWNWVGGMSICVEGDGKLFARATGFVVWYTTFGAS